MPYVIPTSDEMEMICRALSIAGLLNLPGAHLLANLEILANRAMPPTLAGQPLPGLHGSQRSLHLAAAILMTRPNPCDAESAVNDFRDLSALLLDAWGVAIHSDQQKMRKTIDQVVASGSLRQWPGALEALYYLILGDHSRSGNPERPFIPHYPAHDPPLPRRIPTGAVEWFVDFLSGGLIPHLDDCWGGFPGAFAMDGLAHAAEIRSRLVKPFLDIPFSSGDTLTITATLNGVDLGAHMKPMPPGAKRTLRLRMGSANLLGPAGDLLPVPAGQRLIVRALDAGSGAIQLADCGGAAMAGRICSLGAGQTANLVFTGPNGSTLESWSCPCGCCQCDKRHRLEVWNPRVFPPNASLQSFVMYAVKGLPGFAMGAFVCTMYYALLSNGV